MIYTPAMPLPLRLAESCAALLLWLLGQNLVRRRAFNRRGWRFATRGRR